MAAYFDHSTSARQLIPNYANLYRHHLTINDILLAHNLLPDNSNTLPSSNSSTTTSDSLLSDLDYNTKTDVVCLQINLQHSQTATAELHKRLTKLNTFIAFIQEPWQSRSKVHGLPSLTKKHYQPTAQIRTAICHSLNLSIFKVNHLCDKDITTCLWQPENASHLPTTASIILISAYWDSTLNTLPNLLPLAVDYANHHQFDIICCIDSNAHSTLWGCPRDDNRGNLFEQFILQNNLHLLNIGNTATYYNIRGPQTIAKSIIDLTLTSSLLSTHAHAWKVHQSWTASDHRMITFTLKTYKPPQKFVRNPAKCNWAKFQSLLQENWPNQPVVWTHVDIDREANLIEARICTAFSNSCPKRPITYSKKPMWWTDQVKIARKALIKSKHDATRLRTDAAWEQYRSLRRDYKKIITKSKSKTFHEYTSNATSTKATAKLFKSIQQHTNEAHLGLLKLPTGQLTTSAHEIASTLLDEHFPGSVSQPPSISNVQIDAVAPSFPWITDKLVKCAIANFSNNKAPGPDGIKPELLKNLPDNIISRLTTLFAASVETGYTPRKWCHSKTIMIPKSNKNDYSNPRAFRPISLTSFIFKTLERLVLWHLEDQTLPQQLLHKHQHAFRKDHSTEVALSKLSTFLEQASIRKQYAVVVFLDIEGAFDNITIEAIKKGMQKHKIPTNIQNWYLNYLTSRSCHLTIADITIIRYLIKGTAQGGILSPLIFNFSMDDFLQLCELCNILGIGFADDGLLAVCGWDLDDLLGQLQRALHQVEIWANECGLRFSTSKTEALIFTKKDLTSVCIRPLLLYNQPIPYVDTAKYLGITYDAKLSFKPHIDKKLQAAKKSLQFLTHIAGKFWGPSPRLTHWIYTGMVRPAITYGSFVWAHRINTKLFREKTQKLQRLALISLAPVRLHSPTIGLEIATNTIPLYLYIEGAAMSTYLRLNNLLDKSILTLTNDPTTSHLVWTRRNLANAGLLGVKTDKIPTQTNHSHEWNISLDSYDPLQNHVPGSLLAYTDGSRMNNKTGSGVVLLQDNNPLCTHTPTHFTCEYLGKIATVFQAEVYAIITALHFIQTILPTFRNPPTSVHIISDSKSALQAIAKPTTNSSLIFECKNAIKTLHNSIPTSLHWIKAHVGHAGNELADNWAKKGANTIADIVEPFLPISLRWIQTKIRNYLSTKWTERWRSVATARQTKIFFPYPDPQKSKKLLQLDRNAFGLMFRWISGHNYLLRHNNLLDPNNFPNPTCRLCNTDPETSSHLINTCPALSYHRFKTFGTHLNREPPPWTFNQLYDFITHANDRCPEILPHEY
jgi:ribonuclease HI